MASDALDPRQNSDSTLSSSTSTSTTPFGGSTTPITVSASQLNMTDNHGGDHGRSISIPHELSPLLRTEKEYEDLTTVFYTTFINDTRFEILKRYDRLKMIGSGAQGVVWYGSCSY